MIGVVLAGGASRRFGGRPKGLIDFAGRAMALRVADVLAQVCARVAIEAPRNVGYEALDLPLIHAPPEHDGKGPLAALVAGLEYAGDRRVAFAPCDMPLLTRAVYDGLAGFCDRMRLAGAYAATAVGREPLVAVLDGRMRSKLLNTLKRDELPQTYVALEAAGAKMFGFGDDDLFANVNSQADLERLLRRR